MDHAELTKQLTLQEDYKAQITLLSGRVDSNVSLLAIATQERDIAMHALKLSVTEAATAKAQAAKLPRARGVFYSLGVASALLVFGGILALSR